MAYVAFKTLANSEFANLQMSLEMTPAQRRAWHAEMKTRLFNHAHSFTKTMVVVDLTNGPVVDLLEGYKPSRKDMAMVLERVSKLCLSNHKKLVVRVPSSSSAEAGQARDAFMAQLGFSWNAKGQRYERAL